MWFYAIATLVAVAMVMAIYLIFGYAPMDRGLYFNQKIFYFHVSSIFALYVGIFALGINSWRYLKKRDERINDIAGACGDACMVFGLMMLLSGSIWARAAWGVWWNWEARLTTSLLMFLTVVAYKIMREFGGPESSRISAGVGVFAMINVPLTYISVRIWQLSHPSTNVVPGLQAEQRITFWFCVVVMMGLIFTLIRFRTVQLRNRRLLRDMNDQLLDEGF